MFFKFLFLSFFYFVFCDKIFSMNYSVFLGPINIKMNISDKDDNFYKATRFHLDLNLNYTWISKFFINKYINIRNKTKYEHLNISINDIGNANALILKDNFYLKSSEKNKDIIIKDFNFYLFENKNFVGFDSIGLSHNIYNTTFSFIHQLKKHKIIDKLNFAIVKNKFNGGLIFFGGIPNEIIKNKIKSICDIKRKNNNWNCQLNQIGNFINNYEVNFNVNTDYILAPKNYIIYLRYFFFVKYRNLSLCNETFDDSLYPKNKTYFTCNVSKFKNFPPLIFDFINFKILFNIEDLFIGNILMIQSNEYNYNKWIIGNIFLNKFIIQFDLENYSITFYDDGKLLKNHNKVIQLILIIQSIILFISCLFLYKLLKKILSITKRDFI